MAKFNNGYSNIKVKLLNIDENLAKHVYEFGRWGESIHYDLPEKYDKSNEECIKLIDSIIDGTTFPKYSFEGHRFNFSVENISRIALSQLTRDRAIFCSGTHGTMPVKQEYNIPMNIYSNYEIMDKVIKAQNLLEEAYVECLKQEIPYPEARYILMGNLVINCNCSFTPLDFSRACYSRTNNSFCDEVNYIYRKMYYELTKSIDNLTDDNSKKLWKWLINEKKCINDDYYFRASIFNSDFSMDFSKDVKVNAQNDWRKSCWKLELERIYDYEPHLLTDKEKNIILKWRTIEQNGDILPTTYDENDEYIGKNYISTINKEYYYGNAK